MARRKRAHRELRVRGERCDRLVNHLRIDQRLVTLDVHDEVARERLGDFRQPLGSRAVVCPRHPQLAAKRLYGISDALVVSGNDDRLHGP